MEDFSSVIRERRSIRRHLPGIVPETVIREILDEAQWAPSWGNTQSTCVYVLSTAALDRFKAALLKRVLDEVPAAPDIEIPMTWPEPFQSRMKGLMQARMAFVAKEEKKRGIVPPDPPLPPSVASAGLFGAPHLLLVATHKDVSQPYACYNIRLLSQNIVLAAQARGLGTCIMAMVIRYPDLLREIIPGSEDKIFIAGIALGYPDPDAIVNQFPRRRVPFEEFARFVDD